MEMRSEEAQPEEGEQQSSEKDTDFEEGDASSDQESTDEARAGATRRNRIDEPISDYRPFTTRFDEVIGADQLCDEEELLRLRSYLDQQMSSLGGVVTRLATGFSAG